MTKALASLHPAMVESTLVSMHAQLRSVAVVAACLRYIKGKKTLGSSDYSLTANLRSEQLRGHSSPLARQSSGLDVVVIEDMISQHMRSHCPEPLDLLRALTFLMQASCSMHGLSVCARAHGTLITGGIHEVTKSGAKGKADEKKQDTDDLMVNVEGLQEGTIDDAYDHTSQTLWEQQTAIKVAEKLLAVSTNVV